MVVTGQAGGLFGRHIAAVRDQAVGIGRRAHQQETIRQVLKYLTRDVCFIQLLSCQKHMDALASALGGYGIEDVGNLPMDVHLYTASPWSLEHHLAFVCNKKNLRQTAVGMLLIVSLNVVNTFALP